MLEQALKQLLAYFTPDRMERLIVVADNMVFVQQSRFKCQCGNLFDGPACPLCGEQRKSHARPTLVWVRMISGLKQEPLDSVLAQERYAAEYDLIEELEPEPEFNFEEFGEGPNER